MVRVRYFAVLRDQRGLGEESVATEASTAAELYEELARRHGFTLPAEPAARGGQRRVRGVERAGARSGLGCVPSARRRGLTPMPFQLTDSAIEPSALLAEFRDVARGRLRHIRGARARHERGQVSARARLRGLRPAGPKGRGEDPCGGCWEVRDPLGDVRPSDRRASSWATSRFGSPSPPATAAPPSMPAGTSSTRPRRAFPSGRGSTTRTGRPSGSTAPRADRQLPALEITVKIRRRCGFASAGHPPPPMLRP